MNNIKVIRDRLGLTQAALADGMGCTQGNVGHYEKGQTVPPDAARRLIEFAKGLGHIVTFDAIYGEPPEEVAEPDSPVVRIAKPDGSVQVVEERRRVNMEPVPVAGLTLVDRRQAAGQGV